MNSCRGCGAFLQTTEPSKDGYARSLENRFCERCFRIKNYNEYKQIEKDGTDFFNIVKEIGNKENLVVLVIDLFQAPKNLKEVTAVLQNPILLVLTKRDLLPVSLYEERLKEYFEDCSNQIVDTIVVSSYKNYHFDELLEAIRKYQTKKEVYIIGYTNAGKSSMINKILEDYTEELPDITTSMLPSTTIQKIEIKIDESLVLVDTPGLLEEGSLLAYVSGEEVKRITPKKLINPITYQLKERQSIFIDKYARVDCEKENNMTFYFSDSLEIKRVWKDTDCLSHFEKRKISVGSKEDVVIKGLGFFKVMKEDSLVIYTLPEVDIYTRKSLI